MSTKTIGQQVAAILRDYGFGDNDEQEAFVSSVIDNALVWHKREELERAVSAEREECALLVEADPWDSPADTRAIANAIRSRGLQ